MRVDFSFQALFREQFFNATMKQAASVCSTSDAGEGTSWRGDGEGDPCISEARRKFNKEALQSSAYQAAKAEYEWIQSELSESPSQGELMSEARGRVSGRLACPRKIRVEVTA